MATNYVNDTNRSLPVVLDDGTHKYVWGPAGLAYSVDITGNVYVYYSDGLGSVRAIADGSGNVIETYQTDEFGVPVSTQGSVDQPFQYTGQQQDAEDGFYYLRARMYDPATGRFLSRDTFGGNSGNPPSLNRYTCALNDPVVAVDPSGLNPSAQILKGNGSTDNECFSSGGGVFWGNALNAQCLNMWVVGALPTLGIGPGGMPEIGPFLGLPMAKPGSGGGDEGRGLDDALKNKQNFRSWLRHQFDYTRPYSAADARKIWDKLQEEGMNPRLDPGHMDSKFWHGPHINIPGTTIHIPVDPSFTP